MHKFRNVFILMIVVNAICYTSHAQVSDTTKPITSVDADLLNVLQQKIPKKYKIGSLTVTGNKYYDQSLLTSVSGLSVGDEVTLPGGDAFSKAITRLWGQKSFSDIQIYLTGVDGDKISVEINVTERPRLSKVFYKGIPKGNADDLKAKTGFVVGRVVSEGTKQDAERAIRAYYAEKGFRNIKVGMRETKDTAYQNSEIITINIDKGVKVKVNEITFIGNEEIRDPRLKKQMKTKEMSRLTLFPEKDTSGWAPPKQYSLAQYVQDDGFLSFSKTKEILDPYVRIKLFTSAKFDEKKYTDDKQKLLDYYNKLGYRDAQIIKDTLYYNRSGNLNINVKVKEGRKYYFGDIIWRGNTKYSDSILTVILGIKKGDVYNQDLLYNKLGLIASPEGGDISGLYMNNGYLFFRANPVEKSVHADTIDFEIQMTEGPQATYKYVRIGGNDRTNEHVARRELRTIPGEIFSREAIIRSTRELGALTFFDPEKINPSPQPNQDDGTVDLNWELQEKSSDQLELSAGFGGGIGLTGTLGITFNNFSIRNIFKKSAWQPLPTGDGQKLSLRVQSNGHAYRSYNVSFTEPWLGGKKRNGLTVSMFDSKYSNGINFLTGKYDSGADTSYFRQTGLSVGITKQLRWPTDYFSLGLSLNYVRYDLKKYQIDYSLPDLRNGISNNLNLKLTFAQYAAGPNPMFPTSGSNLMFSVQATPPWSLLDKNLANPGNQYKWIEYHKWRFTGDWFIPLTKAPSDDPNKLLVLKLSAKYGFIGKYNGDMQITPFDRFQLGDAGLSNTYSFLSYEIISQRGYPVYDNSNPRINPDKQVAQSYFTIFNKYVAELRYPLTLAASSTIYGLAFFEAANGWYNFNEYNPFQLRRSVGLGARFYLPMFGLLGFDYGIGLDRAQPGQGLKGTGRFTFMLGFEPE